eukprot:COSAG02_NODE_1725_length_11184_cov_171.211728_9_plen_40_part_00
MPQLHPDGESYGLMAAVRAKALLACEPDAVLSSDQSGGV